MFDKVLNMPPVVNIIGFWISLWLWMCQGFWNTRVLNLPLVLNMSGFWIYQSSEYARVVHGSEYASIIPDCLNMPEYAKKCVNISKSTWMVFVLHLIFPFVLQSVFYLNTWLLIERLRETRGYSLKEHDAVFLSRENLIFSSWKYFIWFF